jgi:eukaryotic-like serine/threonine-protein kinase
MSEPGMIGQYRIGERIAVGGAGEIYAASDTKVGRDVAIKFLRPELASDPEWVGRFFAEAKSLGRLNHPNIATLYTLYQDETHLCMVMELVRGQTVEKIIEARGRPFGTKECLRSSGRRLVLCP